MVKRVDDARALFGSFWSDVDDFQELNRDAEAGKAVNRWPLIKAMPINKRDLRPILLMRQQRAWLQGPVRSGGVAEPAAVPDTGVANTLGHGVSGLVDNELLSEVFGRVQGTRRSLLERVMGRARPAAR